MIPIIQVAGIASLEEAEMLICEKVNFLGFPLRLLDGREDISEKEAKKIIHKIKNRAHTIAITYQNTASKIIDLCDFLCASGVQIHGDMDTSEIKILRQKRPRLLIIKSLVIRADNNCQLQQTIEELQRHVDVFITDTYDPKTGRSGATGKTHDWEISRQLVMQSKKPIILAGGLSPENVAVAIKIVQPAGVDVHTKVELPNGQKSVQLVRDFVKEAQTAFLSLGTWPK